MRVRLHHLARIVTGVSLFLVGVLGYVQTTVLDEDAFAGRLRAALDEPDVRQSVSARTVDVAFDAGNVDALLAEALPDEIKLAATPVLELSKPAVASAGAELLGVDAVEEAMETAARSIHRQTVNGIMAEDEQDVVINVRPILVVAADAIVGPAGARAAVGLDLPDSATSINLGSNRNGVWTAIRWLGYATLTFAVLAVVGLITFFATATKGSRLLAARRLGRTVMTAGVLVLLVGGFLGFVAGVTLSELLETGDGLSVGNLTLGDSTGEGGITLGSTLLAPMTASGWRLIFQGLGLMVISYLFGSGSIAVSFRNSVRSKHPREFLTALRSEIVPRLLTVRLWITASLPIALLGWPSPTTRVVLTATGLALLAQLALTVLFSENTRWDGLREFLGWDRLTAEDNTERSHLARGHRHWLWLLAAVLAIVWPSYSTAGTSLLVGVVWTAFALSYRWEAAPNRANADGLAETPSTVETDDDAGWSTRRKVGIGFAAAALAGIVVLPGDGGALSVTDTANLADGQATICNGHAELCDRPFDQVVLAGSHNSMSAAELGWELANHDTAIPAQLDGGIRALLIDVQKWEVDVNLDELALDPEAEALAAEALTGANPPEDGLWMCHNLCQLGGTPFVDFLSDLRVFLETNPDEVLLIVIQDDAERPEIMAAISAAGLDEVALNHRPDTPWPTIGEMIGAGTRLVFMAENDGDPESWYQPVYEGNVTETGFRYNVLEEFDCTPNRGVDDSPLLLINHWVETGLPVPAEADRVNARSVLLDRVEECRRVRGRDPNVIAVNFWSRGDLLAVVDELNGVGR